MSVIENLTILHWLASSVLDINNIRTFLGLRKNSMLIATWLTVNVPSQLSLDNLCSGVVGVVREKEGKGENGDCFTKEHWFLSPQRIPRTRWTDQRVLSSSAHPSFVSKPSVWWLRESQAHLPGWTLSEFHFLLLRSKSLTRVTSKKKGFISLRSPGSSPSELGSQCSRDWVAPTGKSRDSSIHTCQGSAYHRSPLLQSRTPTQAMAPPALRLGLSTSTSIIKSTAPTTDTPQVNLF